MEGRGFQWGLRVAVHRRNPTMVTLAKESYFFIYTQGASSPWLALELPVFCLTILIMSFYPRGHKVAAGPPGIAYKYQIGWLRAKVRENMLAEFISLMKPSHLSSELSHLAIPRCKEATAPDKIGF